jgi:hypothetical protein
MQSRETISNEEFDQWKNDPVSQKIIDRMDNLVEYIKQQWYEGGFEDSGGEEGTKSAEASALKDAYHRGYANGIHEFLRVETVEVMKRPKPDFRG